MCRLAEYFMIEYWELSRRLLLLVTLMFSAALALVKNNAINTMSSEPGEGHVVLHRRDSVNDNMPDIVVPLLTIIENPEEEDHETIPIT